MEITEKTKNEVWVNVKECIDQSVYAKVPSLTEFIFTSSNNEIDINKTNKETK